MRHAGPWLLCIVLSTLTATAWAQTTPAMCTAADAASAFAVGKKLGPSLVRQAWAKFDGGCDQIEAFAALIADTFDNNLNAPTRTAQCRYAGWVEGALEMADTLFITCSDSCLAEGQFIGALVAEAYCELSIALGGLGTADAFIRGPVEVCGLSFETGCDANFLSKTVGFPANACVPYTRAPFLEVYQQTQYNQCAYDPLDPEDP